MKKILSLAGAVYLFFPVMVLAAESSLTDKEAAMVFAPFMIIWVLWMIIVFLFWAGMMIFLFGGAVLWIFMLIDVMKREFKGKDEKLVWVLILALTGTIGAIIYYFIGRKQGMIPYSPIKH